MNESMTSRASLIDEFSKLRRGANLISVMRYQDNYGAVSNFSVNWQISYENCLVRSLAILEEINPAKVVRLNKSKNDLPLDITIREYEVAIFSKAREELIDSFNESLNRVRTESVFDKEDGYIRFEGVDGKLVDGIKYHEKGGEVHIFGLRVWKKFISPGNYPETNSRLLTIAKEKIKSHLPVSRFCQFKLAPDRFQHIRCNKVTVLPPLDSDEGLGEGFDPEHPSFNIVLN